MRKGVYLSVLLCGLLINNLNSKDYLNEDLNFTKILSIDNKNKSNNDDVQFGLEIGAKTDFWEPGLSKKDGQDLLKYDTEGLYLGYTTFKTKIYDTDVFTFEKFNTLASSDSQKQLLKEYTSDKKKDSSIDGYKISVHIMKILNYWFDSNFLDGLEYRYKTKNFIGKAKLNYDALYWFGASPGIEGIDFYSYEKDSIVSFQTKFKDQRFIYNFSIKVKNKKTKYIENMNLFIGLFNSKWSKPTYISQLRDNGNPVIFPIEYNVKGVSLGFKDKKGNLEYDAYLDYGINNNAYIANHENLKDIAKKDNYDLLMYSFGLNIDYTFPKIYSNKYFDLDFIINGNGYISSMDIESKDGGGKYSIDAETLYSIKTALEFTF